MRIGLARRFVTKLIQDIMPSALASLIGGFLLAHYGLSRPADPAVVQAPPASTAMMGVLRDEHALVADFVKAETAGEKMRAQAVTQEVSDDAPAAAPNRATAAPAVVAAPRPQVAVLPIGSVVTHGKAPVVLASLPPLVIAPSSPQQTEAAMPATDHDRAFLTEVIKDRVVAATQRAVAAIGGIPSWFGAIGDRIGGENNVPRPPANLVSAS